MPSPPETEESRPTQGEHRAATSEQTNTTTEDSSGKVEVLGWLAALAETARRRKADGPSSPDAAQAGYEQLLHRVRAVRRAWCAA